MDGVTQIAVSNPLQALNNAPERPDSRDKNAKPGDAAAPKVNSKDNKDKPDLIEKIRQDEEKNKKQLSEMKDGMERLAKLAQEAYQSQNIDLRISYNEKADRFIYKGINPETGEVIREYPPEEVIKRIVTLKKIAGLIVDTTS